MKFKWTRIEKNVCTHWRIEIGEYTLVVEKTPGYVFTKKFNFPVEKKIEGTINPC